MYRTVVMGRFDPFALVQPMIIIPGTFRAKVSFQVNFSRDCPWIEIEKNEVECVGCFNAQLGRAVEGPLLTRTESRDQFNRYE